MTQNLPKKKSTRDRMKESFQVYPLWKFLEQQYGFSELFSMFGPYRGASISAQALDEYSIKVTMPLRPDNSNYVGTHFGGSLYSMCDPFYVLLLSRHLGKDYILWDKSAAIDFLRPGTGEVHAIFHITKEELQEIKTIIDKEKKTIKTYIVEVVNEQNKTIAKITKEIYIRKLPN